MCEIHTHTRARTQAQNTNATRYDLNRLSRVPTHRHTSTSRLRPPLFRRSSFYHYINITIIIIIIVCAYVRLRLSLSSYLFRFVFFSPRPPRPGGGTPKITEYFLCRDPRVARTYNAYTVLYIVHNMQTRRDDSLGLVGSGSYRGGGLCAGLGGGQ